LQQKNNIMNNQELGSATSIVALFQTTKAERQSFSKQIIEAVESGRYNPIDIHLQLKAMDDIIKTITANESYKEALIDAACKEGNKFSRSNADLQVTEAGTKYDYSVCNDPEHDQLSTELNELMAKIKERELFLKALPSSGIDVITKDGEAVKAYPPTKSSTTTIKVIFR